MHYQTRYVILHLDLWNKGHLYQLLGLLYIGGLMVVEWWQPGTITRYLNIWEPRTWLHTWFYGIN